MFLYIPRVRSINPYCVGPVDYYPPCWGRMLPRRCGSYLTYFTRRDVRPSELFGNSATDLGFRILLRPA